MATTPNVSQEQGNKLSVRANTRGGTSPAVVTPVIDTTVLVNAIAQASGVLRLSGADSTSVFTISGTGSGAVTAAISGAGNVAALISSLSATGAPLSGSNFFVNAGNAQFLKNTTVDIIVPSGIGLTISGTSGTTPTLTAITLSGANALSVTYPNYAGTPNSNPVWVDDVTVHAYDVGYAGLYQGNVTILSGTGAVVQRQVRQISTQPSETQQYDGYFATYSGNLYQTQQKRTWRQQS